MKMREMKNIVVAPVGDNIDALFVGLKDFPTERIILVSDDKEIDKAQSAKNQLRKFKIPVEIKKIKGNLWEEMFRAVAEIKEQEKDKNVIINVSTGDKDSRCAATSAAFVNGLRAFTADGDETMLLPILKFSYYKLLTDRKMEILRFLYTEKECCASLEELSKKTKMSLPLISYHIHGTLKSDGLNELGLVDIAEHKGRVSVKLSTLGRLLVKGYVV
jgi:DNA-binding transcriptional ArsR family regulator